MSPPPNTGEHPAVIVTETAPVRTDWRTLAAVGLTLIVCTGAWFQLKARVDLLEERGNAHETRVATLEAAKAAADLHFQRIDDDLKTLLQTTDRIDQNVQALQQKGH